GVLGKKRRAPRPAVAVGTSDVGRRMRKARRVSPTGVHIARLGHPPGADMHRRDFIGGALATSLLPLAGAAPAQAAARPATAAAGPSRVLAPALRPGDTVGLVSPSSPVNDSLDLQLAAEVMQALGLKVRTGAHYARRRGHLAGTDAERAADINTLFADPQV